MHPALQLPPRRFGVVGLVNGATVAAVEELSGAEPFEAALVDLYRDHAKELVEMLWVFVGGIGTAEDIVQEAFLRLHRAWPRLEHTRSVPAYLRATAFNLARSGFRRRVVALRHRPAAPRRLSRGGRHPAGGPA